MSSPFEDPSVKAVTASESTIHATTTTSDDNIVGTPPTWLNDDMKPSQPIQSQTQQLQTQITSGIVENPIIQQAVTQFALQAIGNNISPGWLSNTSNDKARDEETGSLSGSEISVPVGIVELKEIERWSKRLKVAYMVISALMACAAFFSFGSNDLAVLFMALYVWFFAILIFCFELALKGVAKLISQNFGFMYNPFGRLIFLLFVAVMCYELGLLGKIVMVMLTVASFLHLYVIIRHPAFEEFLRKKHYYNVQLSAGSSTGA